MKKIVKCIVFLLCAAAILPSCVRCPAGTSTGLPKDYNLAYQEIYGHCYDSIPYAVVALDLYSDGITMDENHRIHGTGYNLYLSDIFVPTGSDSLVVGTYRSDTTAQPYTFLPGRDYEGTPHGIYLLRIENGQLQAIQVFESGTLVVRDTTNGLTHLQMSLQYRNANNTLVTYDSYFQGPLQPWVKQ